MIGSISESAAFETDISVFISDDLGVANLFKDQSLIGIGGASCLNLFGFVPNTIFKFS